jgi:RNA polymerase sigma factor (sigma-70 family)
MDVTVTTPFTARWSRSSTGRLGAARVGEILGAWQAMEVRVARGFPECRGLDREQLEDLYQETVLALMSRSYASEAHLRSALRLGIRHRALNLHRDQRRRGQILAEHAPAIQEDAEYRATYAGPEGAALHSEDRRLVLGFLAELDPLELSVFELAADGLRYRAIATRLGLPVNEARRTMRTVERKRSRYQARFGAHDAQVGGAQARGPLGIGPLALVGVYVRPLRSWLFGTGATAKATALAASVAVIAAGAVRAVHDGKPSPTPRQVPTLTPGVVASHPKAPATRPAARGTRRGPRSSEPPNRTVAPQTGSGHGMRMRPSSAPIAVTPGSQRFAAGAGLEAHGIRAAASAQTEFGIESHAR